MTMPLPAARPNWPPTRSGTSITPPATGSPSLPPPPSSPGTWPTRPAGSQLLTQLTDWLTREITAGRVASDHGEPALLLAADARDQLTDAAEQAARLARALDHARQLASTLHATQAGSAR